jgi:CYTH domain-containing protein
MLEKDERRFPALHDRLQRQLSRYRTTVRLTPGSEEPDLASATARQAGAAALLLERRLRRIADQTSEEEIHRARIAAKHLRYLLEPFAAVLPAGAAIVERLRSLQDGFGDVHDAQVFLPELDAARQDAERSGRSELLPGLLALAAALRLRGTGAYAAAAREWLPGGPPGFFAEVNAASDALAHFSRRGKEIERKFLLSALPPEAPEHPSVEIEQGYLPGEHLVERLRRIQRDGEVELVRTVKEGSGLVRLEIEEAVTPEVFERLWPLTAGRRLRKRRYRVRDGERTWEIDRFLDRDLVLAEIELASAGEQVVVPDWLRPVIEREVTGEPEYANERLARE